VPNEFDAEVVGAPGDAPLLANTPALVTSGWTMSSAPRVSQGRNDWRRVSTSPPAIGTGLKRRNSQKIVDSVGPKWFLEPADVVFA
jgi:hypothetical protein